MTSLRNFLLAAMAALLVAGSGGATMAGEVLDRVLAKKKMLVALDAEYPPFSFVNANNEMDGFDIAVATEFGKRLGVEVEIVTPGWDVITAGHWAGRWDICIGSMTATKARAEVLDFPTVYYYAPAMIAVHKDNATIGKAEDLGGKRIGVEVATTYQAYLNRDLVIDAQDAPPVVYRVADPVVITYESEPLAFEDLKLGDGVRLDAVVGGLLTITDQIKNGGPFKFVGEPLFDEPIAIAIDKGDPEFAAKVVEIIDGMRADGTLAEFSLKWLGADVTRP
jgi:polar amino acid transport system substrate-binding protein